MGETTSIEPEQLKKVPLFQNLSEAECKQLADISSVIAFEPGEVVLRQGKSSQNLWVVLEGTCEVLKQLPDAGRGNHHEVKLAAIEPLQTFGEMSFFHSAPHSANVKAATSVKLMRLRREDYDTLLASSSWAAYKLSLNTVSTLAQRLRRMDDWVAELLTANPETSEPEWRQFRAKLFGQWNNL